MTPLPAADAFHKCLEENSPRVISQGRYVPVYRGRLDLAEVQQAGLRSLLGTIQKVMNEALAARKRVPDNIDDLPMYFDYIDSDFPNATSFRAEDNYAFIGITLPMIYDLGDICVRLSHAESIAQILGIAITAEVRDGLHAVLFNHLLSFIVTHEFTHHVHGHVLTHQSESTFFSEFTNGNNNANLDRQAEEADADGYAAYHILANFIDTEARRSFSAVLKLGSVSPNALDQAVFSCFVIVAGAFLFSRPPVDISEENIYTLTHPPQAARLDYLMRHSINWCKENRPALVEWMTNERFQSIMRAVAEATWGMNGGFSWDSQTVFLRSDEGTTYFRDLSKRIDAQKAALGTVGRGRTPSTNADT